MYIRISQSFLSQFHKNLRILTQTVSILLVEHYISEWLAPQVSCVPSSLLLTIGCSWTTDQWLARADMGRWPVSGEYQVLWIAGGRRAEHIREATTIDRLLGLFQGFLWLHKQFHIMMKFDEPCYHPPKRRPVKKLSNLLESSWINQSINEINHPQLSWFKYFNK